MRGVFSLVPSDPPPVAGRSNSLFALHPKNGSYRQATVLVVEDDVLTRMTVSDHLRECQYRVLEAASGEEAQALFRSGEPIDVILSDVNMPGPMNGIVLADWISRAFPYIRIVLTSGSSSNAAAASEYGAFLLKPYSFDRLADLIKNLLAI